MTDSMQIDSDSTTVPSQDRSSRGGHGRDSAQPPALSQPPVGYWSTGNPPTGPPSYYPQQMPYAPQMYPPPPFHRPSDGESRPTSSKSRASKGKEKEKDATKNKSAPHKEGTKTSTRMSPPRSVAQTDSGSGGSQQSSVGGLPAKGYATNSSQGSVSAPPAGPYSMQPPRPYSPPDTPSDREDRQSHDRHQEKASSRHSRKERQHPVPPPPAPYPYYPGPPPMPYYNYYNPAPAAHSSQETYYPNSQSSYTQNSPRSHTSSSEPRSRSVQRSIASSEDPTKPRVVTLLIDDARSNDSQLAEVRVPLRAATESKEGFWADARDISRTLQESASRIDGPARVYAMRGKYKQIFLRVSADGEETFTSANLKVGPDRTMEVFVEYIAPYARQNPGLLTPSSDSLASVPQKRRRSFDMSSEEAYANPEPPTPGAFSADVQPDLTPSVDERSRESSPMVVESPSADPIGSRSQETYQSSSAEDTRSMTGRSMSGMSTSASGSQRAESVIQDSHLRTQYSTRSPFDAVPQSATTPQAKTPVSKPTPRPIPRPIPPPSSAASQRTPTASQPPPSKKIRRDEEIETDVEEIEPSRSQSQSSVTLPPGFGGFQSPSTSLSAFGPSAFASFGQGSSRFSTSSTVPSQTAASTGFPRASSQSPLTVAVGNHLKGVISKEPEWKRFQDARNRLLTVAEQVEQYQYLQSKLDEYVGQDIPAEIEGVSGIITREHVMRAFGLPLAKADECREVLDLTDLYGPNGTVCKDPDAVKMFNEPPPISTNIQIGRYLGILREVHSRREEGR